MKSKEAFLAVNSIFGMSTPVNTTDVCGKRHALAGVNLPKEPNVTQREPWIPGFAADLLDKSTMYEALKAEQERTGVEYSALNRVLHQGGHGLSCYLSPSYIKRTGTGVDLFSLLPLFQAYAMLPALDVSIDDKIFVQLAEGRPDLSALARIDAHKVRPVLKELISNGGKSRADISSELGWPENRLTSLLSGASNNTLSRQDVKVLYDLLCATPAVPKTTSDPVSLPSVWK